MELERLPEQGAKVLAAQALWRMGAITGEELQRRYNEIRTEEGLPPLESVAS